MTSVRALLPVWFAAFAATAVPACASNDVLSDAALLGRAAAVFAAKETPADRILGIHDGHRVIVDVRCAGACPAATVRILHYEIGPGPACTRMGADAASVLAPIGLTSAAQDFCIPHILYLRRLYTDRPYQK